MGKFTKQEELTPCGNLVWNPLDFQTAKRSVPKLEDFAGTPRPCDLAEPLGGY